MARPLTAQDRDEIWDLVMAGGTHGRVGLQVGRHTSVVREVIASTGGVRPLARRRGPDRLTVVEREDIACGVAARLSVRAIARALGRPASTVSRALSRNGGCSSYRPSVADQAAWDRAARPKACKLALNLVLREHVVTGLGLQWSPEQIAGWLRVEFADEPELRVSHETVYLSLFVQSKGLLSRDSPRSFAPDVGSVGPDGSACAVRAAGRSSTPCTSANARLRLTTGPCLGIGRATWCPGQATATSGRWSSAAAASCSWSSWRTRRPTASSRR